MAFILPNKKVYLVPNPIAIKKEYMGVINHDGCFMYTGASCSWVLPLYARGEGIGFVNPFNSEEERKYLEDALGMDLNVHSREGIFSTFKITIKKTLPDLSLLKLTFDLTKPMDYLQYLILLKQNDIAPNWSVRNDRNKEYRWVLREESEENLTALSEVKLRSKLFSWLEKNGDNKIKMYNILKVYGINQPITASVEQIHLKFAELIDTDLKTMKRLDAILSDKNLENKIEIEHFVLCGELTKHNNVYYLNGGERIGTLDSVISFMSSPDNSVTLDNMRRTLSKFKKENGL